MSVKSDKVPVAVENASLGSSITNLVKKDWRKKQSNDLWWKITITLAVVIIAGFIIYKAVDDNKNTSTARKSLHSNSNGQETTSGTTLATTTVDEESTGESVLDCTGGSIADSHATFTYQPFNSHKPYTTNGLEFSFDDVIRKSGVGSGVTELDKATAATSKIHYYYNIPRCRIGGGVELDKEPVIRGPMVFAVDQQCSKVYYFTEAKKWVQYISARNVTCSAHGNEEIHIKESVCLEGSIANSNSSFVYLPFGAKKLYRASGVEFSFEKLANKTKLGPGLTQLNKLFASTSEIHYYYNIPRCRIGGGVELDKEPIIRGPMVFAVDQQCSKVYYFTEGRGWIQYISASNVTCSAHGSNNETRCLKGSLAGSYSTFKFYSSSSKSQVSVTGIQYNFTMLVGKLQDLITDYNSTRISELAPVTTGKGGSYYLNLHRCYNGGPANMDSNPKIRGPLIFAIPENCSSVYYLSTNSYKWVRYNSASRIECVNRHGI